MDENAVVPGCSMCISDGELRDQNFLPSVHAKTVQQKNDVLRAGNSCPPIEGVSQASDRPIDWSCLSGIPMVLGYPS